MQPSTTFALALLTSLWCLHIQVCIIIDIIKGTIKAERFIISVIMDMLACAIWGYFYHLIH